MTPTQKEAKARNVIELGFSRTRGVPLVMMLLDVGTLELYIYFAFYIREALEVWIPISLGPKVYVGITAGVLVLPLANLIMGLYPGYGLNDVERIRRQVMSLTIVFSSLLVWDYLAQNGIWSRGILLITWALAIVLVPIGFSWLRVLLIRLKKWGEPIVIIGAGEEGRRAIRAMQKAPKLGLVPVAVLDDDVGTRGRDVLSVPVVGGLDVAPDLARHVGTCAISRDDFAGGIGTVLAMTLPFPHVVVLPNIRGLQSALVEPRDFVGAIGLELKKNLLLRRNRIIKRGLDLVVGVPLLFFFLPLMLFLSLAIYAISPSSPIFMQQREGRGGRMFNMYKLRTMYPDARERLHAALAEDPERRAEWLSSFKLQDDPRTLPVIGSFLRRSSLDELPQLVNVVRGDMSLVGPRPFPDYHLERYDAEFLALRRSVSPGLTGLWQVEVRSDSNIDSQEEYDTYYIRNWSLWLDFYILFKTIHAVLTGRGAR